MGKRVLELTGDTAPDAAAIQSADLLITTPEKWDGLSRHWQQKPFVRSVGLVVMDEEIHLLGAERGPVLEVIVSRMRYIAAHTASHIRILGLSTALANARDLGDWLGIEETGLFNFPPSVAARASDRPHRRLPRPALLSSHAEDEQADVRGHHDSLPHSARAGVRQQPAADAADGPGPDRLLGCGRRPAQVPAHDRGGAGGRPRLSARPASPPHAQLRHRHAPRRPRAR